MKRSQLAVIVMAMGVMVMTTGCATKCWKSVLKEELPRLGHRNFIVIADSAYPLQSAPGIQTVYTGKDHIEVLEHVLAQVQCASHVNPIVYMDAELKAIKESAAPGITELKKQLNDTLKGANVKELPHMEIINKLDDSSKLFNVLLFKTDLTLPYTSVFLELDCGYWNGKKEAALREALK